MSLRSNYPGINFKSPSPNLEPHTSAASGIVYYNSAGTGNGSDTTAFFTGFAQYGIQDNTDWTSATYKTIYSHTGSGIVYGMIACTAGGAETTTFEITIDGIKSEITVTNANGERAFLLPAGAFDNSGDEFTTALKFLFGTSALDSSTLSTYQTVTQRWAQPQAMTRLGQPALQYSVSCLIRMKHSASITNSTATSFSGVLVRKGIAA